MNLLLDTHTLLWWLADDARLSARARDLISDPVNQVAVSAVSGWEIAIKQSLGKLDVDPNRVLEEVQNNGFEQLHVSFKHGLAAGALPAHHRDPFDRMLIAQAQCERLRLLSIDGVFSGYDVEVVW